MFTRQIAYQILFWTFVVIISGHLFCPVLDINKHWIYWITLAGSTVGLGVVVWLRGWIHATEISCPVDPILQKLLVVRMNPARIALLDESGKIVECSGPFAEEVGAMSSYELVGKSADELLGEQESTSVVRIALSDYAKRPISFLGIDSLPRQAWMRITRLNREYLLSLDPMKG